MNGYDILYHSKIKLQCGMRSALFLPCLFLAASCTDDPSPVPENNVTDAMAADLEARPRPATAVIDRIEARLQGKPCIGKIEKWKRVYSYRLDVAASSQNNIVVDEGQVEFKFSKAGTHGVVAGRSVDAPGYNIDDKPIRMVFGAYDTKRDTVHIDFCGHNFGDEDLPVENVTYGP